LRNTLLTFSALLLINCQTQKLETTTGFEIVNDCKNLFLDTNKYNSNDVANIYDIITTEYFDLGNIFLQNEKEAIYDTTFIESTSMEDIEKYFVKEKQRINNLKRIEISGIDDYLKQKEDLLNVRNDLYKLVKKSLSNPQILLNDNLTNKNPDLPMVFEKNKRKFNTFFNTYFKNLNEYYGKKYIKNLSKNKNKQNELIIFDIFHSKILELNYKERELNRKFYNEYKKIYNCKD